MIGFRHLLRRGLQAALVLFAFGSTAWGAGEVDRARTAWESGDLRTATILLKDLLQSDPDHAQARLLLARVYLDLGQGAAAEQELERAVRAGHPRAEVRVPLVEALLKQQQFSRALDAAQGQEVADAEQTATLLAQSGEAHLGLGDPRAAGLAFAQALERRPGLTRALLGQARLALDQDGPESAAALIEQALDADPNSAQALELRGDVERARNRFDAADAAYTQALNVSRNPALIFYKRALARTDRGAFDEAAADIAVVEQAYPRFAGLHYARGYLLFKQGKPDEAFLELVQFLRAAPDNQRAIYYAGVTALQSGQLQQAEEYLARFHSAFPDLAMGAKALGMARIGREDFEGADAVLAPFAKAKDPDPDLLRAYSRALAGLGRQAEAAQALERAAQLQPDAALPRIEMAQSLLGSGQAEAAVTELRMALQLEPTNRTGRLLLVRALIAANQAQAAVTEAEALVGAEPDDANAQNALAVALLAAKQDGRARAALARALELKPGLADAAFNLARLELMAKRPDAARKLYEQVLAEDPGNTRAVAALTQLDVWTGDRVGALERLEAALRVNPDDLVLRTNLVKGYLQSEDGDKALRVVRDAPRDQASDPRLLLLRGKAELMLNRWLDAVATFDELVRIQPESAGTQLLLSTALAGAGNRTGMEEHLLEGVRIDKDDPLVPSAVERVIRALPAADAKVALVEKLAGVMGDHPQAALARAQVAVEQGDHNKAIEVLGAQHKLNPKDRLIFDRLFQAQVAANRSGQAAATAEAWVKKHPDDDDVRARLAEVYLRQGDADAAIAAYRAILKRTPDNASALNNLAIALQGREPAQALVHAERAHAIQPDDPQIADTLGHLLLTQGNATRAESLLAAAYAAIPGNATVGFHYASALAAVGKGAEARRVLLEIAQKSFPEQEEARALLERLTKTKGQ